MQEFIEYIKFGVDHILDPEGLDHLYFIVSFGLLYQLKDWKTVLALVTAFTLGHSLTLALAATEAVNVNSELIETLIPITILISCLYNFWVLLGKNYGKGTWFSYIILLFFGLIHGLGFSNYLKAILFEQDSIVAPLLGFNVGIELAQILIVIVLLVIMYFLSKLVEHRILALIINVIITILVIMMIFG